MSGYVPKLYIKTWSILFSTYQEICLRANSFHQIYTLTLEQKSTRRNTGFHTDLLRNQLLLTVRKLSKQNDWHAISATFRDVVKWCRRNYVYTSRKTGSKRVFFPCVKSKWRKFCVIDLRTSNNHIFFIILQLYVYFY